MLVVSPVLHFNVPEVHALADNVTFSVPQTGPVLPEIVGAVGTVPGTTIIVFEAGLLPQMFSHTAVYVPAPTLIVLVVSPVLHLSVPVVQALADKVTFSFAHTGPVLPVITGLLAYSISVLLQVLNCCLCHMLLYMLQYNYLILLLVLMFRLLPYSRLLFHYSR